MPKKVPMRVVDDCHVEEFAGRVVWVDVERFRHVMYKGKGEYRATFLCERDLEVFAPPDVDIRRTTRRKTQAGVGETPPAKEVRQADGITVVETPAAVAAASVADVAKVVPGAAASTPDAASAAARDSEKAVAFDPTSQAALKTKKSPSKLPQPPAKQQRLQQETPSLQPQLQTGQPARKGQVQAGRRSPSSSSTSSSEQEAQEKKPGPVVPTALPQPNTVQPANKQEPALREPAAGKTQPQAKAQQHMIGQRKDQQTRAKNEIADAELKKGTKTSKNQSAQPRTQSPISDYSYYSGTESESYHDHAPSPLRRVSARPGEESDLVGGANRFNDLGRSRPNDSIDLPSQRGASPWRGEVDRVVRPAVVDSVRVVKPTAIAPHRGRTPHSAGTAVRHRPPL